MYSKSPPLPQFQVSTVSRGHPSLVPLVEMCNNMNYLLLCFVILYTIKVNLNYFIKKWPLTDFHSPLTFAAFPNRRRLL